MQYSLNPRLYGHLARPEIPDSLYELGFSSIGIACYAAATHGGERFTLDDIPPGPVGGLSEVLAAIEELVTNGHLLTHETVVLSSREDGQ